MFCVDINMLHVEKKPIIHGNKPLFHYYKHPTA